MQARADNTFDAVISNFVGKVGWWRLGESSGTTAVDQQGTQNGTYIGTVTLGQPTTSSDMPDKAVALGADGYVNIPHHASHALSACSIFISFRTPATLDNTFMVWSKEASGNNLDDVAIFYNQPTNDFRAQRWNGTANERIILAGALAPDTDYRLVLSMGATNGMRLFLEVGGRVSLRGMHATTGALANNTNATVVGAIDLGTPSQFLVGRVGEYLLLDHEASDAEVEAYCQAELAEEGTYEPAVMNLSPAVYLKMDPIGGTIVADSSGNGRSGSINGTGARLGATALAANVGASNTAIDLGSSAWIEIPHAVADIALTTSYASPWDGDQTDNRFIADCLACIYFKLNALPSGADKAVILAKSNSTTPGLTASYDGSFEAYVDSNGACHVEVRSFRRRPCRIRTPNGAVSSGTTYHFTVQLNYDGVAAWLNGAKFEDGYANLMHNYGLGCDIRGTVVANTNAWTIGKAAWGGQANIVVDEFAVFNRAPSNTMTQVDVSTLAQQLSTPAALAHHIWGQSSATISSGIQSAIDARNAAGGGTVLINPGDYRSEGDITLKSNVRLKANSGTVQINRIRTATPSYTILSGVGSGDMAVDARTINISNSAAAGDILRIRTLEGNPAPLYVDRRYNSPSQTNDGGVMDSECFEIESRTSSSITFVGPGSYFPFAQADRDEVAVFTPTKWIALEGDIQVAHAFDPVLIRQCIHGRIIGCTFQNTSTNKDNHPFRIEWNSKYIQCRDLEVINATITGGRGSENTALNVQHGCTDIVYKDCHTYEGRHGADQISSGNFGCTMRIDVHNVVHDNTNSRSASGSSMALGFHGGTADCILWNCSSNHGGNGFTGWRHDVRWMVTGGADQDSNGPGFNDGAGECYLRDVHHRRPETMWTAGEGVVSIDRCHFENITTSADPSGQTHVSKKDGAALDYGADDDASTRSGSVQSPHASWVAV